ncbi:hypothetical protein [Thiohalomonas denitrificans]|uniref:Uncharacterized protein n=1 Tax=Thiohalomonas denitrificans TaxID=415747 RepID=A0A1G5PHS0_9GAMM|nr:hypothetical protein [Thiohalomonas denitrificans]SCZ49072.1 hypothetical protein SAMN03097708_00029 [Thiohalomonas denitrificans]
MERIRKEKQCSPTIGCVESLLVVAGGAMALVWVLAIDGASPTIGDLFQLVMTVLPGS